MEEGLKLLPCPFCGGSVRQQGVDNVIKCDACGVTIGIPMSKKQEEAFEQGLVFDNWDIAHVARFWNTRAAVTDGQFARAVHDGRAWEPVRTCRWELVKRGTVYDVYGCSACGYEYAEPVTDGGVLVSIGDASYCPNCGAKAVGECER